jgi:pyruvate dehydrogenase E2 component (dihydrolipoamide acetyltransferase)
MNMTAAIDVRVPDIGDFKNVPVLEVLVQAGMRVEVDTPLLTLESDKATLDVPAPQGGRVRDILVSAGERVSKGSLILTLEANVSEGEQCAEPLHTIASTNEPSRRPEIRAPASIEVASSARTSGRLAYTSPSVRLLCRRLGVDLAAVKGTGPRGRILRQDVQAHVRQRLEAPPTATAMLEDWPRIDFERFGAVDRKPLSRIAKRMAANMARNWALIPHVTNFEEADVSDLDAFRQQANLERREGEAKLTMLAFLMKAAATALRRFPELNASLDNDALVLKRYCHVGFATDTPDGLVVPVIRDADTKGLRQIAAEAAEKIALARAGKLKPVDLEGGCFTVSSLGNISGTGFAPIINAPEIAILGAAQARMQARWDGQRFQPQLVLPLSLSWDHRAVSGAAASRFLAFIAAQLSNLRQLLL